MALRLRPPRIPNKPFGTSSSLSKHKKGVQFQFQARMSMSSSVGVDSHLHVWASPQEAADKYPYYPGQEPTLPGHADILLECMEEAGVDGALIVQPINHKFDHSYVTRNTPQNSLAVASLIRQTMVVELDNWRILFPRMVIALFASILTYGLLVKGNHLDKCVNMTNEVGRAMFCKAGELGVPVGFMCMKGLNLHISEIEELCSVYPSTPVLIDHMGFCKPPINDDERLAFSNLLKLAQFPQVHVKFSALFRISREPFPYQDLSSSFSQVVSSFGANRIMWGSDFPFIVSECGYKAAKEAAHLICRQASLSTSELNWVMGGTIMKLFPGHWVSS